jgi:dTDP-4-amino-4,6-dideoxygalactose transaminase
MISFSRPFVAGSAVTYVKESLSSTHQQGDGPFSDLASKLLGETLCTPSSIFLTPSCTDALEMASILTEIQPGDEVIIPSYTFTSAATAIVNFGGVPVFADIEEKSGCLDATQLTDLITSRTKAISWVNYAGNSPNLDEVKRIGKLHGLALIEDNAHGLGGIVNENQLGSTGDIATNSFHATKNIQCGEGGAAVINSPKLVERAAVIREKGTNRRQYISGMAQKYQWIDMGSSFLIAESLAAVLYGNLQSFQEVQNNRLRTWDFYKLNLISKLDSIGATLLCPNGSNIAHMFAFLMPDRKSRDRFIELMRSVGIQVASHYEPLHTSVAGLRFGKTVFPLSVTESFSGRLVRLPLWSTDMSKITEEIVEKATEALKVSIQT